MPEPLILVDSSIWIHFFRSRTADPTCALLESLLQAKRVATTWLIRVELLSGAPTKAAYDALDADLAALPHLEMTDAVFQLAGALRWHLHRKGTVVPVVDSVIAACALHYECALLHEDKHFRLIAKHVPLQFQSVPATFS